MHALKDLSLSETATTHFSFSTVQKHIDAIRQADTVSDKQKASMQIFMNRVELPSSCRDELRIHLIEWHADHLPVTEKFFNAPHILRSMNQSLSAIGCAPMPECSKETLKADRETLHQALLGRTIREVTEAKSGCLMDMSLKIYTSSLSQLGMKISDDTKMILADAVERRLAASTFPEWKESCYHAIGLSQFEGATHSHKPQLS